MTKLVEPLQRSGGEQVDRAAHEAIQLAYRALDRFPELVKRHRFIAGGAAVSGALVVLAGVAIARRMRAGQTADEAIEALTQQEIETPQHREKPSTLGAKAGNGTHPPAAAEPVTS